MGFSRVEFLIEVAQSRDEVANKGSRDFYARDRAVAFKYRKMARELRLNGGETLNKLTDSSIEGASSVLESVAEDESLFSDEQEELKDAAELLERIQMGE